MNYAIWMIICCLCVLAVCFIIPWCFAMEKKEEEENTNKAEVQRRLLEMADKLDIRDISIKVDEQQKNISVTYIATVTQDCHNSLVEDIKSSKFTRR